MRFVTLRHSKIIFAAFVQTSALCGFAIYRFGYCLPLWSACKPAFHRSLSDGELVGSIAYFAGQSSAPDGWLLCNGAAISRTTYATLFSFIGTIYGAGDGSTTFALPNLIDKFVEGSTTAGTVKSAGLPNITGHIDPIRMMPGNVSSNGALYFPVTGNTAAATGDGNNMLPRNAIDFDASRSNGIYGASTTVQPPALTMKPFIYTGKTSLNKWIRTV